MRKFAYATAAVAMLAAASTAVAGTASITFDLSNVLVTNPIHPSITLPAGAGSVTSVDWNLTYDAGISSISWASEIQLELVAPGASSNGTFGTGAGSPPGGVALNTPSAGNTYIWGTNGAGSWAPAFTPDTNFGWPDSSTTNSNAGSTNALNGVSSGGTWTLNIFDSYNDTPDQGRFAQGSFITVNYVPEPSTIALLGLAGLALIRRR